MHSLHETPKRPMDGAYDNTSLGSNAGECGTVHEFPIT